MRIANVLIAHVFIALARRPHRLSLRRALALGRSRRALAYLSPEQLDDIDVTRAEACREAARPIWDAPASWKCLPSRKT
jgi:uncharacterized protein YjiS (DUF1127 family)